VSPPAPVRSKALLDVGVSDAGVPRLGLQTGEAKPASYDGGLDGALRRLAGSAALSTAT
jgi:hypothetical protein